MNVPRDESKFGRETISHFAAYDLASAMIKKAGFQLQTVSMRSESCYFQHRHRGKRGTWEKRDDIERSGGRASGL